MQTTLSDAATACIVGAIAVGTQLIVRSVLLVTRPRRQIVVLLRELQIASAVAVRGALHPDREHPFRNRLARIDSIARGIRAWQRTYPTSNYFECSEEYLDALVLDARADTQEACYGLASLNRAGQHDPSLELQQMITALTIVLTKDSTAHEIDQAVSLAGHPQLLSNSLTESGAIALLAKGVLAHARLRSVALMRRSPKKRGHAEVSHAHEVESSADSHVRNQTPLKLAWGPSSHMAVQTMVAAAIASGIGEAISASRWYWAVMTAFVVFVGATSRSGILTRAVRRVAGTAVGIALGFSAVVLGHNDPVYLIAVGVIGVFGMLYFGPLNYFYSALFLTIMLVAIYAMLGVLDQNVLELRLLETVTGAVIGVLSAYLIFTSNSQPVLTVKIRAYFDSLDALLASVIPAFSTQGGSNTELQPKLDALEAKQSDLESGTAAMSTALLIENHRREKEAVHLMYVVTRSAARIVQAATDHSSSLLHDSNEINTLQAIDEVRTVASTTLNTVIATDVTRFSARTTSAVAEHLAGLQTQEHTPESEILMALLRMEWALRKVGDMWRSESEVNWRGGSLPI